MENDSIYENLKTASCATNSLQVSYAEVEAYLNNIIGSAKAGEEFKVRVSKFHRGPMLYGYCPTVLLCMSCFYFCTEKYLFTIPQLKHSVPFLSNGTPAK